MENQFYVYIIFRLDGTPCYVGKGKGKRIEKNNYKSHTPIKNLINKYGNLPKVKIRENLMEVEAFETEIALIKAIGRFIHGGPLLNMTDGGDGPSGNIHSIETKSKMRFAKIGIKRSEETILKMKNSKKGIPLSEENKLKISISMKGRNLSQEHKSKIKSKMNSKETKIKHLFTKNRKISLLSDEDLLAAVTKLVEIRMST
jgi:hypothetical protein